MTMDHDVIFEELSGNDGHLGVITLNRPQVLNAINHQMVNDIYAKLTEWSTEKKIKAIIIRAVSGRAFCAGGDIRLTYERAKAKNPAMSEFFRHEYHLNRLIFHYPKPYIALLDGITMGGGVGISINGSHRVATENLLFAMPETGIGFFPDVGGTYFLSRLPHYIGYYLGLTGAKIKTQDAVALKLAQFQIQQAMIPRLIDALAETSLNGNAHEKVTHVINQFHLPITTSSLMQHRIEIESCFNLPTVEEIIFSLQQQKTEFASETLSMLEKKSPTSLKVTLKALQQAHHMEFDACMQQEFRLANYFLNGHDFVEGIRAVIIDKDQNPKWLPSALAEISNQAVMAYFLPIASELL